MMEEKFSVPELAALRIELSQTGLDSRDTADLLRMFLAGRGYAVSNEAAMDAACRVGNAGCSLEVIGRELARIAMVQ